MKKTIAYPFTIIYYILFGATLVFFHVIQVISLRLLGYSFHKKSVDLLNFFLLRCLNCLGTRIVFNNPFELPERAPLIIVSNHQSTYDIPPIIWFLRKFHPKFISKKELGKGFPSISYNLRHGGSVLIDRNQPGKALERIKSFAQQIEKNKWSAVIFPEGTRSRDGRPKKFQKKGLLTLFENIPSATILPISINNSWKLSKYSYFPIPLGVKVTLTVHPSILLSKTNPEDAFEKVETVICDGVIPTNEAQ